MLNCLLLIHTLSWFQKKPVLINNATLTSCQTRGLSGFCIQVGASPGHTGLSGTTQTWCWVRIVGEGSTFYMDVFQGWWGWSASLADHQLLSFCPLIWTRLWAVKSWFFDRLQEWNLWISMERLRDVLHGSEFGECFSIPGSICENRLETRAIARKIGMLK